MVIPGQVHHHGSREWNDITVGLEGVLSFYMNGTDVFVVWRDA
jgi:hypothetical protein